MNRSIICFLIVSLFAMNSLVGQDKKITRKNRKKTPIAFLPIEDNPELPRVLLIGDSISIGYTLHTRKLLKENANVHRVLTNCGPTIRGVQQIDRWLGKKEWDVIHFNWGLHDLKYMGTGSKKLADPKASDSFQQVPPVQYEKNLRKLVKRLKKTGATLIWCSTTPVPEGAGRRVVGDAVKYNEIAAKIMKEENIAIDDLYTVAKKRLKEIQRPANVHFSQKGSEVLAEQVAKSINEALKKLASSK